MPTSNIEGLRNWMSETKAFFSDENNLLEDSNFKIGVLEGEPGKQINFYLQHDYASYIGM